MTSRFAVAKQLAIDNIDELVPELFGGARTQTAKYRNRWAVLNKWRSGADIGQMSVWRDGGRTGVFKDYAGDVAGDAIDFVAYGLDGIVSGDSRMHAVEWLEHRYGIRNKPPAEREAMAREADKRREARDAAAAADLKTRRDRARKFFYGSAPELAGTPPARYLGEIRGTPIEDIPNLSAALRYRADCSYWLEPSKPQFPALISCMVDVDGHIGANHYTFVEPDGSAKLETRRRGYLNDDGKPKSSKLMFPETSGLFVPVTYGPSGVKHYQAEPGSDFVGLSEGIEDGASAALVERQLRMHAVGSLSGLLSVPDLACARGYLVFRDNDWAKPQAVALFDRAIARLRSFGKPVEVTSVPADWGKDVNDALRG